MADEISDWGKQMFLAVSRKRKRGPQISEVRRCEDIEECLYEDVNVDTVDDNGDTVLHKAVEEGYLGVVQFLRSKKARIDIPNKRGLTALTLAHTLNNTDILKYLKESSNASIGQPRAGCSPFSVDPHGPSTSRIDNSVSVAPNPKRGYDSSDDLDNKRSGADYLQEGLTKSFHGNMYQLKHYMLILQRASKLGYSFRLAKEMEAADKLDDLVFEYRYKNSRDPIHRFVQFKHRAKESTNMSRISSSCLTNVTEGDFSLLKYFMSYRKINERSEFVGSKLKDYILCTNIRLDIEELRKKKIDVEQVRDRDDFLSVTSSLQGDQEPRCCRLIVKDNHELYNILKRASEVHRLAKLLAEHVREPNKLILNNDILKRNHACLAIEVIDVGPKRFKKNFVDPLQYHNLNPKAKMFRDIFLLHAKELPMNKNKTEKEIWKKLEDFKFNLSATFGKGDVVTDLPDDSVSDEEIAGFFKQFIIAMDQPNESQLTEIISDEIADRFNLQNADFPVNYFQTAVFDWFKEAGKHGRYLTEIDVRKFFDEIQERFSTLVTVGLSLEYIEELKNYEIKFERVNTELQQFLMNSNSGSGRLFTLTSSKNTLLIALNIYQTIESMKRYEKEDSYIFMKLEKLKLRNVSRHVLRAFRSSRSYDLLIIDCAMNSSELYRHEIWKLLLNIMGKSRDKNIVLVNQEHDDLTMSSGHHHDVGFKCLDKDSRTKVLNKMVMFQGQTEMSWGTMLGVRDSDHLGVEELEDLSEIIDFKTLVKLIQNKPIQIGKEVQELDENVDEYYIERVILRHGVIQKSVFEASETSDLFAVSFDSTQKSLASRRSVDDVSLAELLEKKCVMLHQDNEADHFKNFCKKNPRHNVHWLEYKSGILNLRQSTGGISKLVTYTSSTSTVQNDNTKKIVVWLEEDELVNHAAGSRLVLISDTAGMGKSTVLTRLAQKMKKKEPSLLVIRVDLSAPQSTRALGEEKEHRTFDVDDTKKAVDFLVDKLVQLNSGSQVFKRLLTKVEGRAALLFDGFDEISPSYTETVSDLLQALAKLKIERMVVTTRPHTSELLEGKLGVHAFTLKSFSEDNQQSFLIKFWRRELNSDNIDDTIVNRLQDYARKLIHVLNDSINDRIREFTGIPLQTKMVAEVYSPVRAKKHREQLDNHQELLDFPRLPMRMDIIGLYREVVRKKYDIYYEEKSHGDKSNLGQKSGHNTMSLIFDAAHKKLSLDTLFEGEIAKALLLSQRKIESYFDLWQEEHEGGERTGIITQIIDGKPHFVHRTFAEYFAAVFLFDTLQDDSGNKDLRTFFLIKFFIAPEFKTIRAFMNCLLLNKSNVFNGDPWVSDLRETCRTFGTTVYHIAARECNTGILKFFLNRLNSHIKKATLRNLSEFHGQTGACVIPSNEEHEPLSQENFGNEDSQYSGSSFDIQDQNGQTPLHIAVRETGEFELIDCILKAGANIDVRDKRLMTPLHEACTWSSVEVIKFLIDRSANIQIQDRPGSTSLHTVFTRPDDENMGYSSMEKGADIHAQDHFGRTPLHAAACSSSDLEVGKFLIDRGANVDYPDYAGDTPLHEALKIKNAKFAKLLIDNGANIDHQNYDGRTTLNMALRNGAVEIADLLINNGAKIDTRDRNGRTLLHAMAYSPNADPTMFLIARGADINTRDDDGKTLLHAASCGGNLVLMKYLFERGADIHAKTKHGQTPLHFAAALRYRKTNYHSNIDDVIFLVERGANINSQDEEGQTPLHCAINTVCKTYALQKALSLPCRPVENQVVVKFLLKQGADPNIRDNNDKTPLNLVKSKVDDPDLLQDLFDIKLIFEWPETMSAKEGSRETRWPDGFLYSRPTRKKKKYSQHRR